MGFISEANGRSLHILISSNDSSLIGHLVSSSVMNTLLPFPALFLDSSNDSKLLCCWGLDFSSKVYLFSLPNSIDFCYIFDNEGDGLNGDFERFH